MLFPGIGSTKLVRLENVEGKMENSVYAKLELQNPTQSHKDRESRAIIEDMMKRNQREAVIASTGNAAVSLAALGKAIGFKIHIFCSNRISVERKELLTLLKAELHLVEGGYKDAIDLSQSFASKRGLYVANPGNPAKRRGDYEIGREIITEIKEDLAIVVPTNNGTLLSGIWEGTKGTQNISMIAAVAENTKIADSIAGFHKLEGRTFQRVIRESDCEVVNVDDNEIGKAMKSLATEGIFCEPASATTLASIRKIQTNKKNIVLIITGSAFKFAKKDLSQVF